MSPRPGEVSATGRFPAAQGAERGAGDAGNSQVLPSISIVVVSYNQARYLEEAIQSVLSQNYPRLEVFVEDGGSTDGSVEVIRRHAGSLTGWVSERDRGQSHAINKGLQRCSGDIVNWLCSDDLLLPGALMTVGREFQAQSSVDVVAGNAEYLYSDGRRSALSPPPSDDVLSELPAVNRIVQPSCFYRRRLLTPPEVVREDLHYVMDLELWHRFVRNGARWRFIPDCLSVYRVTGENKSFKGGDEILAEIKRVHAESHVGRWPAWWWMERAWLPLKRVESTTARSWLRGLSRRAARGVERVLAAFHPPAEIRGFSTSYEWYVLEPLRRGRASPPDRRLP